MYNDIVGIYDQIFPLNQDFIQYLPNILPEKGGRVLDLGCGLGEVVGLLAAEGYHAVGIDSSEGMIAAAKTNQGGSFYNYGFHQIDRLTGTFDLAFCVGNSLSYLPNKRLNVFMEDMAGLLTVGGCFLIQVINWDRFVGLGQITFEVKPISDGRSFHRRYEPGKQGTVIFHTALKLKERVLEHWTDTLYPKTESLMRATSRRTEFAVTGVYGDFRRTRFNPEESPALIMEMRKL